MDFLYLLQRSCKFSQRFVCVLVSGAMFVVPAFSQKEDQLLGKWRQSDGSVTVNISTCPHTSPGHYCATIIEEVLQPNEKSSLGLLVIKNIKRDMGKDRWIGKFVADNSELNAVITEKSTNIFDVKICALAIFCETQTFNKIYQ